MRRRVRCDGEVEAGLGSACAEGECDAGEVQCRAEARAAQGAARRDRGSGAEAGRRGGGGRAGRRRSARGCE